MREGHGFISIWFFVGLLLAIYGLMIVGTGLYEIGSPPAHPAVLSELRPEIWWGGLLLAFGLFYLIRFYPRKR
jgi:hypothetical protein